jgi:chromosome segregation ATPase/DNA-directed RNA polymerase subunit RPC12/RpoP
MSEASYFVAVCPNCMVSLNVKYVYSGNYVRCKHCDHKFRALAPDLPESARSDKEVAAPLLLDSDESDRFNVNCPTCTATLSVRRTYAGRYVRCRKCNSNFLVPNIVEAPKPQKPKSAEPDIFDQIYGDLEESRSGEEEASQPGPAAVPEKELAAIAEHVDQLLAELESLREERDRSESERVSALAQLDELRAEHDRQCAELATLRQQAVESPNSDELQTLRVEHEALGAETERWRAQVQTLEQELTERGNLAEQLAQREEELGGKQAEIERMAERMAQRDEEVGGKQAEIERLTEQLQADFAQREQELRLECDRQRDEAESLRREMSENRQKHDDEQATLAGQLRLTQEQAKAAVSQCAEHQARIDELQTTLEALEAAHNESLASERSRLEAELKSALEAERSEHARQLAEARALAEENGQLVERLKAEILTLAQARAAPENDLEAARSEIENLRRRLADTETTKRSMSSLLEGMGIRLH